MSAYGNRELPDETGAVDSASLSANYIGEGTCQRFYQRLVTCIRESQELDVLYDCRSRLLDLRECMVRHKQATWVMRETMASMRNEKRFREWIANYDREAGHPPLLEAVARVRAKLEKEGGVTVLHPTVFKDPDLYLPRSE